MSTYFLQPKFHHISIFVHSFPLIKYACFFFSFGWGGGGGKNYTINLFVSSQSQYYILFLGIVSRG